MVCLWRVWTALALVLGGAAGAQAVTPGPVILTCARAQSVPQATAQTLCDAMAGQLASALPNRQVQQDGVAPEGALALVLTVTQALPQQITAHLAWRDGAAQGVTPPLSLSVEDTILRPHMYDRLARVLIVQAGIAK